MVSTHSPPSPRYEFISYSDSYDAYLLALGTPSWVLGMVKASAERITVSGRGDGDALRWLFKTGEMKEARIKHRKARPRK